MNILTKELEAQLGPGTAELTLRIGIHSGPVTAGVLRGQKARFQLYVGYPTPLLHFHVSAKRQLTDYFVQIRRYNEHRLSYGVHGSTKQGRSNLDISDYTKDERRRIATSHSSVFLLVVAHRSNFLGTLPRS